MSGITPETVAQHGLSPDEYARAVAILGREPNLTELGIFSVMWSEHCSYKSSKVHLRRLPTTGPRVICGPGENAGVVDIGDGQAVIFKMESHNHPSFIEPYQGAATGVGGILRDVFTMGARPIANLNALRFGDPGHPKTRHLIAGVVAGIGGYGNCVGVPTVGGEVNFHASYNGNILVNAMTVGLADTDKIFYSAAAGPGNPVIYVGAKTGRDGIHGATMASAEFSADSEAKRPTVQVGDPFTEKLLIEACLELMATDAIVAIQDMGAAGLTSSSVEMAGKGGLGLELDLSAVPVRETHMTAYEIMLSESQERMLMVLKPGREAEAAAIFRKWELDFAIIGRVTETGHLVLKMAGETVADLPVEPLVSQAPQYERPWEPTPLQDDSLSRGSGGGSESGSLGGTEAPTSPNPLPPEGRRGLDRAGITRSLLHLLACPDLAAKTWITDQYDKTVMGDTILASGAADAAIVRVHGTNKGLALTADCTPRYVAADPKRGGMQAVAESWRNITATGATPLALTDNMNFGNPERPRIMGQFALAIDGMAEACLALDYPVVSGNVSLYNETEGEAILPTPAIGGVGLIQDVAKAVGLGFKAAGEFVLLIGETKGHLGQSLYRREIEGLETGPPPPVDLAAERRNGDFVRELILAGTITACHDVSDGGLLVALAEMAMAGGIGVTLEALPPDGAPHALWFGEDQSRYLATVHGLHLTQIVMAARAAGVPTKVVGQTGGTALAGAGLDAVEVAELRRVNAAWLPAYMAG